MTDIQARKLSDKQLSDRITLVESLIANERDWKNLPALNRTLERLIDEEARRETEQS